MCKSKSATYSKTSSKVGRVMVEEEVTCGRMTVEDEVICRQIASDTILDDSDLIPMMENVIVEPIAKGKKTKPKITETFPDSGCQETLVSANLVDYLVLVLDKRRKKRIKGIDGKTYVPCLGLKRFQGTYDGKTTSVLALVTSA